MFLKKQRRERYDTLKDFQRVFSSNPKNMEDILEDLANGDDSEYESVESTRGPGVCEPNDIGL